MPGISDPRDLAAELQLPAGLHHGKGSVYLLPTEAKLALRLAWARSRPLLVVGEAGVGKSQLASAIAHAWQVPLFSHVIQSTTQAEDLFFQYDAVRRLADAQVLSAAFKGEFEQFDAFAKERLDPMRYVLPGVLWRAWQVRTLLDDGLLSTDELPAGWEPGHGSVVLLDEIDKAPPDLPNNLLDVLDSGGFTLPFNRRRIAADRGQPAPLIVITCNGDRPLPAPFLRRCVQLELRFGEEGKPAEDWLVERGQAHLGKGLKESLLRQAAALILRDRQDASGRTHRPGVSEYLDLIYAVKRLERSDVARAELLKELAQFTCKSGTESMGPAEG